VAPIGLLATALLAIAPAAASAAPAHSRAVVNGSLSCSTTTPLNYAGKPTKGAIAAPGDSACFTFTTAEGDVVWSDLADTSGSISLFFDIFNAGGLSTCAGPYGGPVGCSVPTGTSGTWTLQVKDQSGAHTGTFNVSIQRLDVAAGCKAITFGKGATKGKVSAAAGSSCFTFTGTAGEAVFARAVGTSGTLGIPTLLIAGANGAEPCLYSEGGLEECSLSDSGTQTLLAFSTFGNTTGSFRIYDQLLTAPQHCTGLVAGGPGKGGGVPKAGDVACFTFTGASGETAVVTLSGLTGTLSPLIDLFRPTGTSACDTPGLSVTCPLGAAGTWSILVDDNSVSQTGTGSFTATLTSS